MIGKIQHTIFFYFQWFMEASSAILRSWEIQPFILILFIVLGTLYTRGWWQLRQKSVHNKLATGWHLFAYITALILITIALMSPIDVLGGLLFYMHMIQHLLLTMFAAPLLMLANPLPFILWGLPDKQRRTAARWLSQLLSKNAPFRKQLKAVTGPGVCWIIMVAFLWGWHDPDMYNSALRSEVVHNLEHITFFLSALLYWWHATGAGPRIHKLMSRPARIGYLLAGIPANMLPGIAISFSTSVLYTYYETVPRLPAPFTVSVLSDQTIGGIIMWVPGSMMFIIAALAVIAAWLQEEEQKKITYQQKSADKELLIS